MSTVRDLLTGALRLIGVVAAGETPNDDDIEITKSALSGMIDSWSNNRLLQYTLNPYTFNFIPGKQQYTLGPGGDWDIVRPMVIENAYVRLNANTTQQLDIKLRALTDEQYGDIAVKNTASTFPFAYYDNGNYPQRTITMFPVPNAGTQMVVWLWQPLLNLEDIEAEISYPPGYERMFRFNLAYEIAPEFGKICPDQVTSIAKLSREELERINDNPVYLKGSGGSIPKGRSRGGPSSIITGGYTFGI